ncbi:MAG: RNA polymerase sigma factor [Gemmataceae bacterium]
MDDERSAILLARWREGDQEAAAQLFERYADRLVALAKSRLPARLAQRVDAEDVVQSVYRSFFAAARAGRYELERGGDLWRLLVTITINKVHRQFTHHQRDRRDSRREQTIPDHEREQGLGPSAPLLTREPGPLEVVAICDELENILRDLKPAYRQMVELRLQGYNVFEIADETGAGERTVRRVLDKIKTRLELRRREESGSEPAT